MHRGEISLKDRKSSPKSPIVWHDLSLSSNLQPLLMCFLLPWRIEPLCLLSFVFSPPALLSLLSFGEKAFNNQYFQELSQIGPLCFKSPHYVTSDSVSPLKDTLFPFNFNRSF